MSWITDNFNKIINFSADVDIDATQENIKKGIDFRGPNVWILAFAVIVASVGLNVNSTPVIIGAMLISPLMGPIMGTGLSIGINDSELLRRSLKNLSIMVGISLIASTAYFLISPLALAEPTELLARTRPTIYDVFIAFFGGLAGIVESCRKDRGTVISGVAIATALMPPLCTAGFGLATGNLLYFGGALYLFTINSLFIALATFIMIRYLKFPFKQFADPIKQRKVRRSISFFTLLIMIPSVYTAIIVIQENTFNQNVKRFVSTNRSSDTFYIIDYSINHTKKPSTLELSIAGEKLSPIQRENLLFRLESYGIFPHQVKIKESIFFRDNQMDETILKSFFERADVEIAKRDQLITNLKSKIDSIANNSIPYQQISRELAAQNNNIESVSIAKGMDFDINTNLLNDKIVVIIKATTHIDNSKLETIKEWLKIRLSNENIIILQTK